MHVNVQSHDTIAKLVPGGDRSLTHLSDGELLASTRALVGKSNQLFAALLVHLAEVEARGVHRTVSCASLYTYCIYELRFSEDAAARRAGAAKLVKRFPLLFDAVAKGELHLTGLLMLGPHLTPENHVEVLARAKFRTKKELAKLVRELHPLPLVPDVIEPLGPTPMRFRNPTWQEFIAAWSPAVRELPPGQRPSDWANDTHVALDGSRNVEHTADRTDSEFSAHALAWEASEQGGWAHPPMRGDSVHAPARDESERSDSALAEPTHAPARGEPESLGVPLLTRPQQYHMQFSTSEEHVQLVERAKALLARSSPGTSLGELHLQGMRLLVAALEKQRFGVANRSQTPGKKREPQELEQRAGQEDEPPRQRSRYVPAAVRRAVLERDGGRCAYVDERGERCCETHFLELHHLKPFGHGGVHTASNLALFCAAHNALAAERDFGPELIAARRDAQAHEPLRAQHVSKDSAAASLQDDDSS